MKSKEGTNKNKEMISWITSQFYISESLRMSKNVGATIFENR